MPVFFIVFPGDSNYPSIASGISSVAFEAPGVFKNGFELSLII